MDNCILLCKLPRNYPTYFKENSESLALGYLTAYLRKHEHKVTVFDASLESHSLNEARIKLLKLASDFNPLLIGFTIADMTFIESTVETIRYLRGNGIKAHFTMGGHSPTFNYKEIFEMSLELDSIVMFEGENTLLNLVSALNKREDWKKLPNIAYRENGKIVVNSPLPFNSNLDELPFPTRDYLPYVLSNLKDIGIVPIAASRGCYMNCSFCSIRRFYDSAGDRTWKVRSEKNVIQEIKMLKEKFPEIQEIVIVDDVFTGPPKNKIKRAEKFRNELEKNGLRVMFSISDRADVIDEKLAKILREIGVRQILLGFESSSQEILDIFNKKIRIKDHIKALKSLEKNDIDTAISFINFTPWSTLEQVEENVRYFLSLGVNMIQGMLNRFQIYDGTFLAQKLEEKGLVYGRFPNKHYKTLDERVDKLYEIVNKNFNPYLFIAYHLKILERELRIVLFNAEKNGDVVLTNSAKKYKLMYKNMMEKIMEEAVSQFLEIIGFVKDQIKIDNDLNNLIKQNVFRKSNEWFKMIELFRYLCPVLNGGGSKDEQYFSQKREF